MTSLRAAWRRGASACLLSYILILTSCPEPTDLDEEFLNEFIYTGDESGEYFANPIIANGADPWMVEEEGRYYYIYSNGSNAIYLQAADDFTRMQYADALRIWLAPSGTAYSRNTWAPELHKIGARWYVYFAADDGDNRNHRMYVLESANEDPFSNYSFKGAIADQYQRWAIDGTVWQRSDDEHYFIWSGWEGTEDGRQDIYIARMLNPWTVTGERVRISAPSYLWEWTSIGINEGPQMLNRENSINIIYSANGFWTNNYALGRLKLRSAGADPLIAANWNKDQLPVFRSANGVYSPGHASFLSISGGRPDWIVFHANQYKSSLGKREIRVQPFIWDGSGNPLFGEPQGDHVLFRHPHAID